jgi:hypothetical protein
MLYKKEVKTLPQPSLFLLGIFFVLLLLVVVVVAMVDLGLTTVRGKMLNCFRVDAEKSVVSCTSYLRNSVVKYVENTMEENIQLDPITVGFVDQVDDNMEEADDALATGDSEEVSMLDF